MELETPGERRDYLRSGVAEVETDRAERRRAERIKASYLVGSSQIGLGIPGGPTAWIGRTLDVSLSGLRIHVIVEPIRGGELEVEVALDGDAISATTSVVHVEPSADGLFLAGLEFTSISDSDRRLLARRLSGVAQ